MPKSKISAVLELLSDGAWHQITELEKKAGLNEVQLEQVVAFLREYDLAKVDAAAGEVRINENFRELMTIS